MAQSWHNCDPAHRTHGTCWAALPCYSYYSQMIGPTNWHLSTNDWAGYVTAQWQPNKLAVFSAGLRWEREQLPPPIAALNNPAACRLTEKLPSLGNNWGPRLSLAIGSAHGRWPVLRLGYGMYYGRTENATIETALTQTGSFNGDLNYFIRPTAGLNPSRSPAALRSFPYVLAGPPANVVKPGAVEFAPNFRNPEVHQAVAAIEQPLPGRVELTAGAMLSLGRRLPVSIDTNLDPSTARRRPSPIPCATRLPPGTNQYPVWPARPGPHQSHEDHGSLLRFVAVGGLPQRLAIEHCRRWLDQSRLPADRPDHEQANSTYEAAMVKITRYGRRGLSLHAHYTYAHAMDWNPNESPLRLRARLELQPGVRHQQPRCAPLGRRHGHL